MAVCDNVQGECGKWKWEREREERAPSLSALFLFLLLLLFSKDSTGRFLLPCQVFSFWPKFKLLYETNECSTINSRIKPVFFQIRFSLFLFFLSFNPPMHNSGQFWSMKARWQRAVLRTVPLPCRIIFLLLSSGKELLPGWKQKIQSPGPGSMW